MFIHYVIINNNFIVYCYNGGNVMHDNINIINIKILNFIINIINHFVKF